jgi:hypothetical protein
MPSLAMPWTYRRVCLVVYTNSARLHSDAVWLHGCMCSRWPGEPPVRSARARESPCGTCSARTPESCVLKQHGPGTEVACTGAGPDRWAGNQTVDGCTLRAWLEHVHETKHALNKRDCNSEDKRSILR